MLALSVESHVSRHLQTHKGLYTMASVTELSKHEEIQAEIFAVCKDLGFWATEEYRGKDWRADVFAVKSDDKFAFEIQISAQSLKRTLERQAKYTRDGIRCCWLFETPQSKLSSERPDLPLFYVTKLPDSSFIVSLSGRRELPLREFVGAFLQGSIRFSNIARTQPKQLVRLVFFEMKCWKCGAINHVYYVDAAFRSACNVVIEPTTTLWGSDRIEYRPEIIRLAQEFMSTEQGKHLRLGEIKRRYSQTVRDSYMSFGCYKCDSIFGDWFVMEAQMEAVYGYGQVASVERDIELDESIVLPIPHWCYPGELPFCDSSLGISGG